MKPAEAGGERLYRALLRAYPRHVRDRYDEDMLWLFRHRRDERLAARGRLGPGFWLFVLGDVVRSAPREWLRPLGRERQRGTGTDLVRGWLDDLGYALRRLVRSPGFSLTALFILVLGIGVNSTAFGIVNSLLFQPPPFPEPERIVDILQDSDGGGASSTSYSAFEDIARTEGLFESVGAVMVNEGFLEQDGTITPLLVEFATTDYMDVLGLSPSRGRWFDALEHEPTGPSAAVVTYRMWRDRLGSDPDVIGRTLRVNGSTIPIVGVGPQEFNGGAGPVGVDVWMSISSIGPTGGRVESLARRQDHPFRVRARLLPGVSVERAREAMDRLADQLAAAYPEFNADRRIHTLPSGETRIDPERDGSLAPAAALVMAVVALVLVIGTLNLANLLLVRSTARAREIAIRVALGAGRGRLVRVVLSEALVLAVAGGLAGLAIAVATTRWIARTRFDLGGPLSLDVRLDARVLVFTAAISILAGLVFGLLPALRATARPPNASLRDDGATGFGARRRFGLTGLLVTGQVAVTLLLLTVASVFLESLVRARSADPGLAFERMAYVQLTLQPLAIESFIESANMYELIEQRIEQLPQVEAATIAAQLPAAQRGTTTLLVREGPSGEIAPREIPWNVVLSDYFQVTGVPLLHGRPFDDRDFGGAEVAIVSEAFALGFFGLSDVVGEVIVPEGSPDSPIEIVGVAGDVAVRSLGEAPAPSVYRPYGQWGFGRANYLFIVDGPADQAIAAVRDAVRAIDPRILLVEASSMDEHLGSTLQSQRMAGTVLSGLGGLALLLALLGAYGVVSFAVSRRRQEVGIRIALGAAGPSVVGLFLRDVAGVVLVGAGLGLALSIPVGSLVGQTFAGGSGSPILTGAVALGLVCTALVATFIPALRATRTDPRETLRGD